MRRIPGAPGARGGRRRRRPTQARADGRAAARTLRGAGREHGPRAGRRRRRGPGAALAARAAHVRPLGGRRRDAAPARSPAACARAACARPPSTSPASAPRRSTPTTPPAADRHAAGDAAQRRRGARSRALIDGGVDAVMLSTAVYPGARRAPGRVLARAGSSGELRERLGFRGVSDHRRPRHARRRGLRLQPPRAPCSPSRPGIDLPLFSSSYRAGAQAAEGLLAAARDGAARRGARCATQARRVLALRARIPR